MTRVSSFQTWQVRIPYEEGRRFGNHIIVRLRTDDGLEGIGYVSNLSPALIKAQKVAMGSSPSSSSAKTPWPWSASTPP